MPVSPRGSGKLAPGAQIGAYRLVRLVGEGAMAVVWEAVHVKLGRKVAIKVLRPAYAARRDAVASFFQEARIASTLNHPHIVKVEDFLLEPGLAACVMEFLEGRTLAEYLETHGPMDVPEALQLAHQVADGLAAAHAARVVHRDIKPANIFLARSRTGSWNAKILDFGIANLEATDMEIRGSLSRQHAGTPAYMSPEQIAGKAVDSRSDVYSFGVVLYEVVTGRLPFVASSYAEYVQLHGKAEPKPPHRCMPGPKKLHKARSRLIMRCLEKDPEKRYRDGAELRNAIEEAARAAGMTITNTNLPVFRPVHTSFFASKGLLLLFLLALATGVVGIWTLEHLFSLAEPHPTSARSVPVGPRESRTPAPRSPARQEPRPARMLMQAPSSPAPARPRGEPAVRSVTFQIVSRPPGAEVYGPDGRLLGVTPLRLVVPEAALPKEIRIRRAGYRERRVRLGRAKAPRVLVRLRRAHRRRRGRKAVDTFGTENPFAP